jgi:hypothetical protein
MGVYTVHICIHKDNYCSYSSLLPPLWPLGTRHKLEIGVYCLATPASGSGIFTNLHTRGLEGSNQVGK